MPPSLRDEMCREGALAMPNALLGPTGARGHIDKSAVNAPVANKSLFEMYSPFPTVLLLPLSSAASASISKLGIPSYHCPRV